MALLKCRHCDTEIDSNARKTRCPGCGQLFPFACDVCDAPLRPPFHVFDDERYLNSEDVPLCQEHFQRQCPQCSSWFAANENPGYFLCKSCMENQEVEIEQEEPVAETPPRTPAPVTATSPSRGTRRKPKFNIIDGLLTSVVFLSMVAVVVILGWQIFVTVRPILGF